MQTSRHQKSTLTMTTNSNVPRTAEIFSKINIEDLLKKVNNGDHQSKDFAVAVLRAIVDEAEKEVLLIELTMIVCWCDYIFFVSNILVNLTMQIMLLLTNYRLHTLFHSN